MNSKIDIASLRRDYTLATFDETDLEQDPFKQFAIWFAEAMNAQVPEPNAMVLSTLSENGRPESRIVLLKSFDHKGFVFFTNYLSKKGKAIQRHPSVALNFCWLELQRQIRIEGVAEKISEDESDAYFLSRPFESQLGAHASNQSEEIASRADLENSFNFYRTKFATEPMFRPKHWGGYLVKADYLEFWQGRTSRLHDRFSFKLIDNKWDIKRLAP